MKTLETTPLSPEDRDYVQTLINLTTWGNCGGPDDITVEIREDGIQLGARLATWDSLRQSALEARVREEARKELPVTAHELSKPDNRTNRARSAKREARVNELLAA